MVQVTSGVWAACSLAAFVCTVHVQSVTCRFYNTEAQYEVPGLPFDGVLLRCFGMRS